MKRHLTRPLTPHSAAATFLAAVASAWVLSGIVGAQTTQPAERLSGPSVTSPRSTNLSPSPQRTPAMPAAVPAGAEAPEVDFDRRRALLQRRVFDLFAVADFLENRLFMAEDELAYRQMQAPGVSAPRDLSGPAVEQPAGNTDRRLRTRDLIGEREESGQGASFGRKVPFIRNVTVDDKGRIILDYGDVPTGTVIRPNETRLEQ